MAVYAFILNKKMKKAFKNNRAKLADINAQIEDNLSGIRVVKSFANEAIEEEKFDEGKREREIATDIWQLITQVCRCLLI